jgi:hypothetical protein
MVWFFHRGDDSLRVETRRDRKSREFLLILRQSDGTELVDRFKSKGKFQKRLDDLERKLKANRWSESEAPGIPHASAKAG